MPTLADLQKTYHLPFPDLLFHAQSIHRHPFGYHIVLRGGD